MLPAQLQTRLRELVRPVGRYSLPDWAFLPLSALAGAGLVYAAMSFRPGFVEPVYSETGFEMRGLALQGLIPGPGTRYELITENFDTPIARLSATASFESSGQMSAGVGVALSPDWEAQVVGRMLRVEVDAKPADGSEVDQIRVGYFTTGFGDSGRIPVALDEDWQTVGICFQVPETAEPNNNESMGVWPGDIGNGEGVLIRAYKITIEPEQTSLDTCQSRIGN